MLFWASRVVPVDFELGEEQKLLQQAAREFAAKTFDPKVCAEYERRREFPWELYRKTAGQGFIGMTWPVEYGGQGASFFDSVVAQFELLKADPPVANSVLAGSLGCDAIAEFGTHEQKAAWLPRVARGEATSAVCYTEPSGGSDIARVLDVRAVRRGGLWVINGTKTFITNSTTASVYVVLVQTDLEASPPYRGQTEFVLGRRPGIEASEFEEKLGFYSSPWGEVRFVDVEASDQEVLGGPANLNKGFYMGLKVIDANRVGVGVAGVATAEAALERATSYAKERIAFGRRIAGFQGLAHRLVEAATKIEVAKAFMYKCAWLMDRARRDGSLAEESVKLASMLKWYGARLAVECCDLAMDVLAGHGVVESDVMRWYRFAKILEIVEGTKEIQKNTIARIMLGRELTKTF